MSSPPIDISEDVYDRMLQLYEMLSINNLDKADLDSAHGLVSLRDKVMELVGLGGRKRAKAALQTLKAKGLYAATMTELFRYSDSMASLVMCGSMWYKLLELRNVPEPRAPITDDTWYDAIEITMLLCDPGRVWERTSSWSACIEEYAYIVHTVVYLLISNAMSIDASFLLEAHRETRDELKSLRDSLISVTAERDAAIASCTSIKEELSRAKKGVRSDTYQIEKPLRDAIAERDEEIDRLQALVAKLSEEAVTVQRNASTEVEALPTLPTTGIAVMGGHPNLVNRLRGEYPDWTYIGPEDTKFCLGSSTACVFTIAAHMSHKVHYRLHNVFPAIPERYVSGTNLDTLLLNMRRQYATVIKES